jgi:orotidine-5'-phosphate decarboxylase
MSRRGEVPERIEDRLITALDVPSIDQARMLIDKLDGLVSFFKIGLWLQFAASFDGLIDHLVRQDKKFCQHSAASATDPAFSSLNRI